jgi:membrane protein
MEGQVNVKVIWQLLSATYTKWTEDHAQRLGAALAFYTVFPLAPLLLIVIAIAGLVFGQEAAEGQIIGQIQGLVGEESAKAIQGMLEHARQPSTGLIAAGLALVTLLFGATSVFAQLQDALNTIWGGGDQARIGDHPNLERQIHLNYGGTGKRLLAIGLPGAERWIDRRGT